MTKGQTISKLRDHTSSRACTHKIGGRRLTSAMPLIAARKRTSRDFRVVPIRGRVAGTAEAAAAVAEAAPKKSVIACVTLWPPLRRVGSPSHIQKNSSEGK